MYSIKINTKICKKDNICINGCPASILTKNLYNYPKFKKNLENLCIKCGHCISICPNEAIFFNTTKLHNSLENNKYKKKLIKNFEFFLKNRRSIRKYKKINTEKRTIESILSITKYAPSAKNSQPIKWLIINNKEKIQIATKTVLIMMKNKLKNLKLNNIFTIINEWSKGNDKILRNTPTLIICYSHKIHKFAKSDIATAISYIELIAPLYKLGSCWAGYLTSAIQENIKLKKLIQLPKNYLIHGGIMIGESNIKYYRTPKRNAPKIKYI